MKKEIQKISKRIEKEIETRRCSMNKMLDIMRAESECSNEDFESMLADVLNKMKIRDRILNKTERLLLALDADYPNATLSRFKKKSDILNIQSRKEKQSQKDLDQSLCALVYYCLDLCQHDLPIINEQTYIYVLACEMGKYYIGQTKNVAHRFMQHKYGYGATWTTLNPPIALIECIPSTDIATNAKDAEMIHTKKYMAEYGIENVRGAAYSQIILSEASKRTLRHYLNSSNI